MRGENPYLLSRCVIKKFDYKKEIESLGGVILSETEKTLLCEYLGFNFTCYKKLVKRGEFSFERNFRSCIDSVDYFRYYMNVNCKHDNLVFDNSNYIGMREKVTVACKEHGEFSIIPEMLINRGSGCSKCYNKYKKPLVKNKGLDKFVEEANLRFDNKFDYSLAVYKNTMTPLVIKCPKHGVFKQTPNEHLQSMHACPSCLSVYNSFRLEDYAEMCPDGSYLYVVNLFNDVESFYKIGISKEPEKRFKQFKCSGYSIGHNVLLFNKDSGIIFGIEDILLEYHSDWKYKPLIDFKGKTECFSFIKISYVYEVFYTLTKISSGEFDPD